MNEECLSTSNKLECGKVGEGGLRGLLANGRLLLLAGILAAVGLAAGELLGFGIVGCGLVWCGLVDVGPGDAVH